VSPVLYERKYSVDLYRVVRSRAQIYSAVRPQFAPILEGDEGNSDDLDRNLEMTISHLSTESLAEGPTGYGPGQTESPSPSIYPGSSLAKAQFGSRLVSANSIFSGIRPPSRPTVTTASHQDIDSLQKSDLAGHGSRQTESPSPSLYPGSSLAKAKFGSRLVSANSIFSGSRPPSRLTVTTANHHSVMSDEGHSVRELTRLGLGEHVWGQIEPTPPFLYSEESFANAKFGGRLVPLNPLLSRSQPQLLKRGGFPFWRAPEVQLALHQAHGLSPGSSY
jgi:hypothetical protein